MKGQTALEYLITYGWAILVILVVLAVLWYYGVFNPVKWNRLPNCEMNVTGKYNVSNCVDQGGYYVNVVMNCVYHSKRCDCSFNELGQFEIYNCHEVIQPIKEG